MKSVGDHEKEYVNRGISINNSESENIGLEENKRNFRNLGRKHLEKVIEVLSMLGITIDGRHCMEQSAKEKLIRNKYLFLKTFEYSEVLICTRKNRTFNWYLNICDYQKDAFILEFKTYYITLDYELSEISLECKITEDSEQYGLCEGKSKWLEISLNNAKKILTAISNSNSSFQKYAESFLSSVKLRYKLLEDENIKFSNIKDELTDVVMCEKDWKYCTEEEYSKCFQIKKFRGEIQIFNNSQGYILLIESKMSRSFKSRLLRGVENRLYIFWGKKQFSIPISEDYSGVLRFNKALISQEDNRFYQWAIEDLSKAFSEKKKEMNGNEVIDFWRKFVSREE